MDGEALRTWRRRILRIAAALVRWGALLLIVAWLAGRVFSDRTVWSQWLLWIPTPAVAIVACTGFLASYGSGAAKARRRRQVAWTAAAALIGAHLLFVEHRALRTAPAIPPPEAQAIKLVHWNVSVPGALPADATARAIVDMDGDLTILSNAGGVPWQSLVRGWLGPLYQPLRVRPFVVLTRLPIIEFRTLVAAEDDVAVAILVVEAFDGAQPTVIYLFDLPSDPRIGRAALARRVRTMLAETGAPPPDVAVGDFNMTRGSASLALLLPELRHAYDGGGHGIGATFPRLPPVYHIDHVLLGRDLACPRYDLVTPAVGFHRAQVAWITQTGG
jgi:hypothetical protein